MRILYIFILILFQISLFGETNSFRELPKSDLFNTVDTLTLKRILKDQILSGSSGLYSNSFDIVTYNFSESDLLVTLPVLNRLLEVNGYKRPSNDEFKSIVQKIFGRLIDFNLPSKYLYVNFDDKNDRKFKYLRNDNSIEIHPYSVFLIKNYNFITELYALPEILNYSKFFPDVDSIENIMNVEKFDGDGEHIKLYKWMEDESVNIKKNIKTFIARNLYLFNNDTTQLSWLLDNDTMFMRSIIQTYGFWKDQSHKSWFDKQKSQ